MLENATFHHIGTAVASIDKVKPFYQSMGYTVSDTVIEPVQKVYVAYARKEGFPTVEMLEPLDETSPVQGILKKNGNTPYHMCYTVDKLSDAIAEMRKEGFRPLSKPVPGHGLDDALMVFLYNINYGLIQVMENK
mgnify:CR=1 FL=1